MIEDETGRDDLGRGMDEWQLRCRVQLMDEYGHSWQRAAALAWTMRLMLEADLREPPPLVIVTGV